VHAAVNAAIANAFVRRGFTLCTSAISPLCVGCAFTPPRGARNRTVELRQQPCVFVVRMDSARAPDLASSPPRPGRSDLGGYAWLARLADKARAEQAGTAGDYVAYCPISVGFLVRAGVPREEFDALVRSGATDDELVAYFDAHVSPEHKAAANRFVLVTMKEHLDEQDAEESAAR